MFDPISPTGSTRLAAVIGSPVRHSLSPAILNAAFAATGIDWIYVALEVAPGRGGAAVEAMRTLGIAGLSVTMPHKADAARSIDRPSASVVALGACNCVFWDDDVLAGDNTDGDGFVAAFTAETGRPVAGLRFAVLGAGGAARSIIEALGRNGADAIDVWSRTAVSAAEAAKVSSVASPVSIEQVHRSDVVINATPVGMAGGQNPHGIPLPAEVIREDQIVCDIVYEPRLTPLMVAAHQRGATVLGGVGMLVHQAARQFTHWTGLPAPLDAMKQAVLHGK